MFFPRMTRMNADIWKKGFNSFSRFNRIADLETGKTAFFIRVISVIRGKVFLENLPADDANERGYLEKGF